MTTVEDGKNHWENECHNALVICEYCKKPVVREQLETHQQTVCPKYPKFCQNEGCGQTLTRGSIENHYLICDYGPVECS